MRVYRTQTDASEPSVHAHYLYAEGGQRAKKLVRKQGGQIEVTIYIDGIFEYQRIVRGGVVEENSTLHMMDNQSQIALVRVGRPFTNDHTPAVKYHLGDHLGSSNLVIDNTGNLINREEYTPYGETSFGSFARKRYRLTAKESDEESGLIYFGARYYAPWLLRWSTCDPIFLSCEKRKNEQERELKTPTESLFVYVHDNPLNLIDPEGLEPPAVELTQKLQETADNLMRTLGSDPKQHGMLRRTFEAALAEAQGAELTKTKDFSPGNQSWQHYTSMRSAANALQNNLTRFRDYSFALFADLKTV
jgi:RHS repeat-associated protein